MPKFSIIIPVYNVAPYLRECLNSVLAQTFTDWEAICVDDGSTDGSGAILDEYAARNSRFKVFHQKNAGVSAARNAALDVAKGEYVAFLDADDKFDRDWLKVAEERIRLNGVDLLRMNLKYWDEVVGVSKADCLPDAVLTERDEILKWSWTNLMSRGWACVCFLRRELNGVTLRFPEDVRVREDLLFLLLVVPHVRNLEQYDCSGYYYRTRADSACGGRRDTGSALRFAKRIMSLWQDAWLGTLGEAHNQAWQRMMSEIWASCLETVLNDEFDANAWSAFFSSEGVCMKQRGGAWLSAKWKFGFIVLLWFGSKWGILATNRFYAVGSWCKRLFK